MAHKLGDAVAVFIDDNLVFPPPVTLKDKAIRKYSKAMLRGEGYIDEFFEQHGSQQAYVRTNYAAFVELVAGLKAVGSISDNKALEWIQEMLLIEQKLRTSAALLILSISSVRGRRRRFLRDMLFFAR